MNQNSQWWKLFIQAEPPRILTTHWYLWNFTATRGVFHSAAIINLHVNVNTGGTYQRSYAWKSIHRSSAAERLSQPYTTPFTGPHLATRMSLFYLHPSLLGPISFHNLALAKWESKTVKCSVLYC
jgi:hypothetical protein